MSFTTYYTEQENSIKYKILFKEQNKKNISSFFIYKKRMFPFILVHNSKSTCKKIENNFFLDIPFYRFPI